MQYFRQSGAETFITVNKYVKQALILSKTMRGLDAFTLPNFCLKIRPIIFAYAFLLTKEHALIGFPFDRFSDIVLFTILSFNIDLSSFLLTVASVF